MRGENNKRGGDLWTTKTLLGKGVCLLDVYIAKRDVCLLEGSGDILCAETGTSHSDEINLIEKGKNYGWPYKEGSVCYNASLCDRIGKCMTRRYR